MASPSPVGTIGLQAIFPAGQGIYVFSYLELVELPNGDIVLQKSDDDGEPLVVISFSDESRQFMSVPPLEVARAMIQAGIQVASAEADMTIEEDIEAEEELLEEGEPTSKTVH